MEPPPRPVDWQVRRAVARLRPHALLLLEHPHDLGRAVFDRARWWRFPIVLLEPGNVTLSTAQADVLAVIDHFIVHDDRARDALRARGVGPDRITLTSAVAPSRPWPRGEVEADPGTRRTLAALLSVLGRDWAAHGTPRPRGTAGWGARLAESGLGRLALGLRARRVDSLAALRGMLGACDTILCLGNGPSSEGPDIRDIRFDVLFRVNCRWMDRGGPDRPQVVFTGDSSCLRAVRGAIIGFRTVEEERRLLARRLLGGRWRPLSYLTVERLPVSMAERRWPARPTNGAAMVATAAALAPRRLIIAGIDLFQHPDGAYPGGSGGPGENPGFWGGAPRGGVRGVRGGSGGGFWGFHGGRGGIRYSLTGEKERKRSRGGTGDFLPYFSLNPIPYMGYSPDPPPKVVKIPPQNVVKIPPETPPPPRGQNYTEKYISK